MSPLTPTTGPAFVGKASGSVPNLFWRCITFDQLRAQPQYQGLPSVEHLSFKSTADFRKVRQDSQLWTDLHQGLLTTGKLNAALGFYEPAAARRLGIPRDRVNHNALLSAAANLQRPSYGVQLLDMPAAPVLSVQASANAVPLPPGLETAITVSEYEAAAIKLANASTASGAISKSKRARMRKQKQRQEQLQQQQHAAGAITAVNAAAVDNAAVVPRAPGQADSSVDPYGTSDAKRNRCTMVATRGEGGLRMAWGSTQEAAALFSVIHLFPHSQLEEVGLCWVDPKSQIPTSWGFQAEDLPPLGASPDGLIRHRPVAPPPPPAARPHPVASDLSGETASPTCGTHQTPDQLPAAQSGNAALQTPFVASTQNQVARLSAAHPVAQPASAQRAEQAMVQSVQMHDPSLSEFEVLLAKLEISSKNMVSTTLQSDSTSTTAVQADNAQPALTLHPHVSSTSASAPSLSASAAPFSPATQLQESVMARRSAESSAAALAAAGHTYGSEDAKHVSPPEEEGCQEEWLEAVEIKNVCPFREAREVSSNGKSRRLYRLSDPGPYSRVPCHFVPQLQMEMLASGAKSALVVSRSATKGVRVFRMQRHAGFLQQMLHTIKQLYTKYVKRNVLPPPNIFFEQTAYQQFLRTTQRIAESVEVVIDSEVQALPHVMDNRMFV